MSSYIQVIVGGMLLVTAFLFGRYINNQPVLPAKNAVQVADSNDLNRQKTAPETEPESVATATPNTLQKSLRERILGEREKERSQAAPKANIVNKGSESPFVLPEQEIVVPDFSSLESAAASKTNQNFKPDGKSFVAPAKSRQAVDDIVSNPTTPSNLAPESTLSHKERAKQNASPPKQRTNPPKRDLVTKRGKMQYSEAPNNLVPIRHREAKLKGKTDKYVSYKTVFGDTLHGLSSRFFGSPDYYFDIYLANTDRMENPSSVPVNTTIRIPLVAELIKSPVKN